VMAGKHTIVSAHGNSLRALLMVLENLSPDQIQARELATGVPIIYRIGDDTRVIEKRDLTEAAARELPTPP
jgi:2,3-bisphosphoglycerate-dependent phosphoglycerate mutase